jgi:hypothetical protein
MNPRRFASDTILSIRDWSFCLSITRPGKKEPAAGSGAES